MHAMVVRAGAQAVRLLRGLRGTRVTAFADRRGPAHERVFEHAGVGAWTIDLRVGTLRTNSATRAIMEWPEVGPLPTREDLRAAVHPEDRAVVAEHVARLQQTGEEYSLEHRLLLPSGRVRHMKAVVVADCDPAGNVVEIHGVTLDVTDLWQARAQAERQRQLGRTILGSLTEGYVLARDGVVVEVNDALCRITGFSGAALVGSRAPHPYWPVDQVDPLLALQSWLVRDGSAAGEFEAVHRSGRRIRLAVTVTALPTTDGTDLQLLLVRDVTEDRERESSLRTRATTDPLTGVQNSRAFRTALQTQVAEHTRTGAPLSLALIDVDHFKLVNDRFGHAVGDEVLVEVVARLTAATAGVGRLARVGGEEFAVLLPGVGHAAARGHLAAALQALRCTPLPTAGTVTASAGVAELQAGMSDDALYRRADELLYEAKARGRDQVR
jgi:diguanylate cyclase (GGDEF)-like protein/PAS domain S-box-containing protein